MRIVGLLLLPPPPPPPDFGTVWREIVDSSGNTQSMSPLPLFKMSSTTQRQRRRGRSWMMTTLMLKSSPAGWSLALLLQLQSLFVAASRTAFRGGGDTLHPHDNDMHQCIDIDIDIQHSHHGRYRLSMSIAIVKISSSMAMGTNAWDAGIQQQTTHPLAWNDA